MKSLFTCLLICIMALQGKSQKTIVWLDDIRDPSAPKYMEIVVKGFPFVENSLIEGQWVPTKVTVVWVKDFYEFVDWIRQNGMPDGVSFDHDLARQHIEDFVAHPKDQPSYDTFDDPTGYDAAKWLVDYCVQHNVPMCDYYVHSANPVGSQNIKSYITNAKKHLGI